LFVINPSQLPRSATDVQSEAIVSLLQLIAAFPTRVALKYVEKLDTIHPFLSAIRDSTREAACQLTAFVLLACPASQRTFFITGLLSVLQAK
jgi:hypothetical protein